MKKDDIYRYYALCLLFGKDSPKIKKHDIYKIDFIRDMKSKGMHFVQKSLFSKEKRTPLESINNGRTLRIGNFALHGSHIAGNGISKVITLQVAKPCVEVSDTIVSPVKALEGTYDYDAIEEITDKMEDLIHILREGTINKIPLLINDFPNISAFLFEHVLALRTKV